MVTSNNLGRKSSKKVDLRLAQRDGALREQFRHDLLRERQRSRLSAVTGITDESLIQRMVRLGFNADNVDAIRYAPIAEVAWASGRVTEREHVLAIGPAFSEDLFYEPEAVNLFRSWLSQRPSSALWVLWEDYTKDLLNRCDDAHDEKFGEHLHQLATRVALASGGLLNQGDICTGEQRVLNRIARVYGLADTNT